VKAALIIGIGLICIHFFGIPFGLWLSHYVPVESGLFVAENGRAVMAATLCLIFAVLAILSLIHQRRLTRNIAIDAG
jgi:hypothetical protein